jgi:hypothetical protein
MKRSTVVGFGCSEALEELKKLGVPFFFSECWVRDRRNQIKSVRKNHQKVRDDIPDSPSIENQRRSSNDDELIRLHSPVPVTVRINDREAVLRPQENT